MRLTLQRQFKELDDKIVEMCSFVEKNLRDTKIALENRDVELSEQIISRDKLINDMEADIESLSTTIIIRQQPVASDLRKINATMKIISDLERIGDLASEIATIVIFMGEDEVEERYTNENILKMFDTSREMLKQAIDSFIVSNSNLANRVIEQDDEVDYMFENYKKEAITQIIENQELANEIVEYIQIAKYLERIADHATSIAIWQNYIETGKREFGLSFN